MLPPFHEPKINGAGSTTNFPKARMLSVPDIIEGEILIPPPPSAAPPPPPPSSAPRPPTFIPVPPQYFGEMDPSVKYASLQPPPMAPPKPPSLAGSVYSSDLDIASLKPPPMAPPKNPSETSSIRGSLSSLELQDIPDCPKFTPPPPPGGKAQPVLDKSPKAAPLKPVRMSSISNLDIQSQIPTAPVASNPTPSSFNPQNTAKLYDVQKSTFLLGQSDKEKVQSILLLEDSSANSVVVVNGNSGKNGGSLQPVQSVVPPTKPARRNSSAALLQNDQPDAIKAPSQPAKVEVKVNPEPVMVQNIRTEVPTPIQVSPRIEKKMPDVRQVMESPGRSRRNSPVVNHRQLNTQRVDGTVKKETSTSPFALLLAAKERDKQRAALSQQNSNPTEQSNSVIQPSAEKPNSFTVTPRDPTPDSPNAQLKTTTNVQPLTKAEVTKASHSKPELSSTPQQSSPMNSSVGGLSVPVRDVESGEDLNFIPPPPEFANSDIEDEPSVPPASHLLPAPQPSKTLPSTPTPIFNCPPPSHPAPAPPVKTAPQPSKTLPATPAPIFNCPPPSHPAPAAPVKTASQPSKTFSPPIINCPPPSHPAPAPPVKNASQPSKTLPSIPTPIINCPPPSHPAPAPPVKTAPQPSKTLPATPAPIINCPPPSHPAPASPVKSAPTPYLPTQIPNGALPSHSAPPTPPTKPSPPATPPPVTNGPRVSPKPKPPTYPPKAPGPPPNFQLQSKPVQTKATQPPAQGPPSVSASQATLLSILQKKMLEMDPKFSAAKEVESNGDDWNSPLSDDETPSYPSKTRSATLPVQSHGLDLKELESKAAKKVLATSAKSQNSPGSSSKQQHGMTFTVRPGTKQPITPVSRDGSP
ncbi:extensin isoform X2 [Pimephales promelas]|nr:extensin isoform X2 [Pimephales promelas]